MCGIAGIVDFNGKKIDVHKVRAMCDSLKHRGPDGEGMYDNRLSDDLGQSASVVLGHRRLSIIDLEKGHQPMFNEDNTISLVYNGMIYNYKELKKDLEEKGHNFKTNSDTEVIIHLYEEKGEELVHYLRGMFSFALWDSSREKLLLARDIFGKKPLFYSYFNNRVVFASELQAMVKEDSIGRDVDITAIDRYLSYYCIPAPDTIYKDIKKVQPAHMIVVEKNKIKEICYWQIDFRKKIKMDIRDIENRLFDILKDAVRVRLISDVPLGVLLSGGVDSSSIVAIMNQVTTEKIKTFSIGFQEPGFNELPYAKTIAAKFGTEHHEFIVKPHIQEVLPKLIRHFGEPYGDSSAIPTYYLSQMASKNLKVVLNGDGGDEAFIGYNHYMLSLFSEKICANSFLKNSGLFNAVKFLTKNAPYNTIGGRINRFMGACDLNRGQRYKKWVCYYGDDMKEKLYSDEFKKELQYHMPEDLMSNIFMKNGDLNIVEASLLADLSINLPNDLLVKMDIASMANSLETRSPFLDKILMEFVASLPLNIRMKNFKLKYLLKDAMSGMLPSANLNRPKKGFVVPLRNWFRGELKDYLICMLTSGDARIKKIFNMHYVNELIKRHMDQSRDNSHYLWLLMALELWFREFER